MTRVFLDDRAMRGDRAVVTGGDAHHLHTVLRMGEGDRFTVVDERGAEREATIVSAEPDTIEVRLGPPRAAQIEPAASLWLYHGLPRASRHETALRMCTELGVRGFVPVLSARSVVRLDANAMGRKLSRWQRIVDEAARQSGRTRPALVTEAMGWREALEHFRSLEAPGVMPSAGLAGSDAPSLGEHVAALAAERPPTDLALFIGPESGFDLREEASAQEAGIALVTMGPRILRTETAAVVAAALCLDRLGELGGEAGLTARGGCGIMRPH